MWGAIPCHDCLDRKQVGKAHDDGGDRRPEQKADDQTEGGESHRGQEEVPQCTGQVADPGARGPCRRGHMAGVGHHDRGDAGHDGREDHGTEHEREHGEKLSCQQDGASRLTDKKLAQRTEAVLIGDLRGSDPKGHDAEKHGRPVHAVDQPVRLGELR